MRLSSNVTWGLAWLGLAVVVAVPSADFLTGKIGTGNSAAVITSTTEAVQPVKTSSVTTEVTPNGVIIRPAGSTMPANGTVAPVVKTLPGNKLPDYISGGATADAGKAPAAATEPAQVALIDPVAPVPFPATARPRAVTEPVLPRTTTTTTVAPAEPALIVDETMLTGSIDPVEPTPAAPSHSVPPAPIVDDSANWKKAGLGKYLENNGLLSDSGRSSASVTITDRTPTYDPNGFYLSDGPNTDRASRRARVEQMLNESNDSGFNLF